MPDRTEPKDLETVLARLREEWQELADLLTSQGKSQDRVLEVEKILLRDASGQYRGKISANPDGSADLLLSDQAGNAWVRLGVNRDGEAFFELKDQKGESSFKAAVGAPGLGPDPGRRPLRLTARIPLPPSPLRLQALPPSPACLPRLEANHWTNRAWSRRSRPPIKTSPLAVMPMPPYLSAWRNWRVSIGV